MRSVVFVVVLVVDVTLISGRRQLLESWFPQLKAAGPDPEVDEHESPRPTLGGLSVFY
jgi:hypothetical protein